MKKSEKENEYYLKYNLVGDPFPTSSQDKVLFLTTEANNRLERIKKLVDSSQDLVFVISALGCGKTVLSRHLCKVKNPGWAVCLIKGNEVLSPESLAHQIIQQTFPENTDDASMSISKLHKYLEHSDREETTPVFIIDDAHKLSFDTLQFILQLADLRYNETLFRFVLFAEETIHDNLDKPALQELSAGIVSNIYLPPLSREQTATYIEYRLSSYGEINKYPFTDESLLDIYKASGGLPGGINLLARKVMQAPSKTSGVLKFATQLVLVTLLVSASFVAAYLVLSKDEVSSEQVQTATLTLPPKDSLTEIKQVPKSTKGRIDKSLSLKLSNIISITPPSTTNNRTTNTPGRAEVPRQTISEPVKVQRPVQRKQVDKPKDDSPAVFSTIHGEEWLRRQTKGSYVLQLMSASAESTIEKLIKRHSKMGDGFAGYTSYTKSGKPRYMLVYGPYPNRKAAAEAVSRLPSELKSLKPWPRSIAGIVKDLDGN